MYEYIKNNLEQVNKRIADACKRSGRSVDEITLISVTKTFDMTTVNASLQFGITDVAENKVQEIEKKYPLLEKDVKKHLIGHLQRNKVKKVVGKVDLIQSVDSIRLMDEIDKCSKNLDLVTDILIQVNIGKEEQKSGFNEDDVKVALEHASKLDNIRVLGFMAMAPFFAEAEKTRIYFKKMKKIFETYANLSYNDKIDIKVLSMGMSGDFEVAIEEGATMIRVGSAIYGKRDYNNN